jgi:hypothetical protein
MIWIWTALTALTAYRVSDDTIHHHPDPGHIGWLVFFSLFALATIAVSSK